MITNQINVNRPAQASRRINTHIRKVFDTQKDNKDLDDTAIEYMERMRGMKSARWIAVIDVVVVILMVFGLFAIYQRHGYLHYAILKFIGITSTAMMLQAIFLWRMSRRFFLEHNKK